MLLILSASTDVSTDYVIEWLRHYNVRFARLHDEELQNIISGIILTETRTEINFVIGGEHLSLDDIEGVWFRRGFLQCRSDFKTVTNKDEGLQQDVAELIKREDETLLTFVADALARRRSLNNQFAYNTNKLQVLQFAQNVGLRMPHTLITTNRNAIIQHLGKDYNRIITKPIQDMYGLKTGGMIQVQHTALLSDYEPVPESFYYSLFQEKIEKQYELRIFFIEETFYAAAVFSKATDGRDLSSGGKPVRVVPYRLPEAIRKQLIQLNKLLDLNSGSIDMIVSERNEYYFLEVNPVGQYGYIGTACNFYLEEKIARYFCHDTNIF